MGSSLASSVASGSVASSVGHSASGSVGSSLASSVASGSVGSSLASSVASGSVGSSVASGSVASSLASSVASGSVGGGVRVWTVSVASAASAVPHEEAYGVLDPAERERFARFRRGGDRMRYLAVHHVYRTVLGHALGVDPADVGFRRFCARCGDDGHGKPVPFAPDGTTLSASLSHSAAYALIAIGDSAEVPVGVDIERVRADMDWSRIPCVQGGRNTHGFEQWTRAEALVKAAGTGLSRTPPRYTGHVFGTWRAARVPGSGHEWFVRSVRSPDGYAASVASGRADVGVTVLSWRP
ncbi:4'-phosphopantetheinyl transferase family protein [Streptomyces sp. NPDC059904]|uniref:4'-phosphopantetheinyl transferase family protein n=1 Tax=Streptomyces sp. NPDC059904 TaxID=3346996 RepID=UPI00365C4564